MIENNIGLIEMGLFFGSALALALWELLPVRRSISLAEAKISLSQLTRQQSAHFYTHPLSHHGAVGLRLREHIPEPKGSPVSYFIVKALLSGLIVAIVSEVARRSPGIGGLIASLPLVSVLAVIWLWRDTADSERIASHMQSTFWYVLPSLPMFFVMPAMLRHGTGFWVALAATCLLTMALYALTMWLLPKLGVVI